MSLSNGLSDQRPEPVERARSARPWGADSLNLLYLSAWEAWPQESSSTMPSGLNPDEVGEKVREDSIGLIRAIREFRG